MAAHSQSLGRVSPIDDGEYGKVPAESRVLDESSQSGESGEEGSSETSRPEDHFDGISILENYELAITLDLFSLTPGSALQKPSAAHRDCDMCWHAPFGCMAEGDGGRLNALARQ